MKKAWKIKICVARWSRIRLELLHLRCEKELWKSVIFIFILNLIIFKYQFEVGKRVVGKLPKERIPVVKKEEQRVMLQCLFLKTHQEALKHPKKLFWWRIWGRQSQGNSSLPAPQSFSVENSRLTQAVSFTRGWPTSLRSKWGEVEKVMFKRVPRQFGDIDQIWV